jgi:hypothetical protein
MNDETRLINVDALCVLKPASNSQKIMIGYESIERVLDKDFEQLKKQSNSVFKDAKSLFAYVENHDKLKVLLEKYNYCKELNAPYQGLELDINKLRAKYQSDFPDTDKKNELLKKEKEKLFEDLQERLLAFYLDKTYKLCEQKLRQKNIFAYSNRKAGWTTPKYLFNQNFSAEFKTNFGYGSVSYFFSRLSFKGIDIIALSDWIIYQRASYFEIIRYSAKYPLDNESWKEAFEYVRDAYNLMLINEKDFITKFIIEECEKMVLGLERFLYGETFNFLSWSKTHKKNWKRIFTDVHKEGHNLIEFRGEKISGALDFIEKILQFEEIIIDTKNFINRIEICNRKVQPALLKEIPLIEQELIKLNKTLDILKPIFEELENRYTEYKEFKNELVDKMILNNECEGWWDFEKISKKFKEAKPEYEDFLLMYEPKEKEYRALISQISSLETTKTNIQKYNDTIDAYFNNNQI